MKIIHEKNIKGDVSLTALEAGMRSFEGSAQAGANGICGHPGFYRLSLEYYEPSR